MISKEIEKMTARTLTFALAAVAFLLAAAPAAPAAPIGTPALKLTATSQPTNFAPGEAPDSEGLEFPAAAAPQYNAIVTNVGSAPTTEPITFTDTLPAGVTPVIAVVKGAGLPGGATEPCADPVGQTVTCDYPLSLRPNEFAQLLVIVEVAADAPSSLVNQVGVTGGGAAEAQTTTTTTVSGTAAPFDFLSGPAGLSLAATGIDGTAETRAGSHPGQLTVDVGLPSRQKAGGKHTSTLFSSNYVKDVKVNLPRGMIVNPTAVPVQCTEAQLELKNCPDASAIGVFSFTTNYGSVVPAETPLYNMVPPPGAAAEFAWDATNSKIWIHLIGKVNSAGEFELGTDTSEILARELNPVFGAQAQLWGNPYDESHDSMRGSCVGNSEGALCPVVERKNVPLVTMPSSCSETLTLNASAFSWEHPTDVRSRTAVAEDSLGEASGTDGCGALDFEPTISAKPTTNLSDSPTGLNFNLHIPQEESFKDLAEANLKAATVTLPQGISVNPSSAGGLGACTPAQFGLTSGVGQPVRTDANPAHCPDDAKIGSVEVHTQLLDHPVSGAIYTATPFENPFGSLLAIYLAIHDEESGVVIKLAGRVSADPNTGQLTATFAENPELPFEDFKLNFFDGPRAALKTPLACGTHTVTSSFTPWSTPEGATEHPTDSFQTSVAASGSGNCPGSEAQAPNAPGFTAGTIAPQAGVYSPFVLKLTRPDGTQQLTGIDATLPKGLVAKLAGTGYCSEAQIAAAKSREAPRQGVLERQSPSCPLGSEVGTVTVGAGAGITPFYAQGHAYLAGPYKGAPLSLVVITPAVAGPYDLGSVVVRNALYVNPETAEVHAVSDPLPTIREGIPLDLRSIALKLDRPDFTLNPTSCDPMAVVGQAATLAGQSAALNSPFQVGGCSALGFKPKLAISLKGGTKRDKNPALKAVLTYPKGSYANIASAQVTLPHSAFLDQSHIGTVCTRVQFAAEACPAKSIYGKARAITPLLDQPLEGPVYLRSSSHELPDLVAALNGQIDVDLVGRIDTGKGGGIRNTFEATPDAPVSKFVLEMQGGKKGLLVNSENICRKPQRAIADFTAQNGKVQDTKPLIANSCKGKAKKKKHKAHKPRKGSH